MVTIYNKSNRPLGIAGKAVLPDKEIKLKDKEVFCDIYDEDGFATGERQLIPGLKALEGLGLCTVRIEESEKPKKEPEAEVPVEAAVEEVPVEKKKTTRGKKKPEETVAAE